MQLNIKLLNLCNIIIIIFKVILNCIIYNLNYLNARNSQRKRTDTY